MSVTRSHIAVIAAVAALSCVPPAFGDPPVDHPNALTPAGATAPRPDDRALARGPGAFAALPVSSTRTESFDAADAALGAAVATAVLAFLAVARRPLARLRRSALP